MYSLDIIVPFFNEELYLEKSISNLLSANIHSKIYLVNNNSTDNSKNIALKFAESREDIIYLETDERKGKGVAIQKAISNLQSTHTIIHDADLEYDPKDIIYMKQVSEKMSNSLILGSRFIGNRDRKSQYLRTYVANRVISLFFSILNNQKISDVATCYKLVPNKYLKEMNITENGFAVEVEIISKYLKFPNPDIQEAPISYQGRTYEEGKKISYYDGIEYLYKTIYYRIKKISI